MGAIEIFRDDYSFLSNFYVHPFEHMSVRFRTVEHYFQAAKAVYANQFLEIVNAPTPGYAKRLGRRCEIRPTWERDKEDVMWMALRLKFTPGSRLASKLLATDDRQLIEGNSWGDTYWGVCRGKGQNRLGELLMELRDNLREGKYD